MAGCSMVFQHQPMQPRMRLLSCLLKERSYILENFSLIQPEVWSTVYLFLPTPEKMLLGSDNTWWAVKCDTIRTNSEIWRSNVCDSHEIFMKHLGNDQLWLLIMMMMIYDDDKNDEKEDIWRWHMVTTSDHFRPQLSPSLPCLFQAMSDRLNSLLVCPLFMLPESVTCWHMCPQGIPGLVFHATFMVLKMGSVVKCS